jgi:hypothetical protein
MALVMNPALVIADEPDCLARGDGKADTVDRPRDAILGIEVRAQVADGQQRVRHLGMGTE